LSQLKFVMWTQEYLKKYTWAITTAPSEGVGLGRHIEESVQNSTGENLDPYGSRVEMTP
jgi:hypothetical protein